ncbi:hypothetical protein FRC06_000900 [Ceratobasidium sp. 370]|nr:hypothetical protein FRC06_000900 [Ceratobasidium sp. 370]
MTPERQESSAQHQQPQRADTGAAGVAGGETTCDAPQREPLHRSDAGCMCASVPGAVDIIGQMGAGKSLEELMEHVSRMKEQLRHVTYMVEVFDNQAPPHVVAYLSQNEEDQPNLTPQSGENLWQLTHHQEGWVSQMIKKGEAVDRTEELDKLYSVKDMGQKLDELSEQELEWAVAIDIRPGQVKEVKRDGELSAQTCRELMGHPLLNDMVLDTWPVSVLFNARLNQLHFQVMRKDGGGVACMLHFWLGAKIMIKIFDMVGGNIILWRLRGSFSAQRRLRSWLRGESRLWSTGMWEQRSPFPLSQLVEKDLMAFKTILKDKFKKGGIDSPDCKKADTMSLRYRYESDEFVRAGQNVFYRFVAKIEAKKTPHAWLAAASMHLYALLLRWVVGCEDNHFFPAAILPTKSRYTLMGKQVDGAHDSAGLCSLEFLLERWCLPWTYGAVGSSNLRNSAQWTERVRSLHRIVQECVAVTSLGCRMARLSKALKIVESVKLRKAFEGTEEFNTEFAKLRQRCGASHSRTASVLILAMIIEWQEERNGKLSVVQGKMASARSDLGWQG